MAQDLTIEDDSHPTIVINHVGLLTIEDNDDLLDHVPTETDHSECVKRSCTVTGCRMCKRKRSRDVEHGTDHDAHPTPCTEAPDLEDKARIIKRQRKVFDGLGDLEDTFPGLCLGENPAPVMTNSEVTTSTRSNLLAQSRLINNTSTINIHSSSRRKPHHLLPSAYSTRHSAYPATQPHSSTRRMPRFGKAFPSAAEYKDPEQAYQAALRWALDIDNKAPTATAGADIINTPRHLLQPRASVLRRHI